ncbi:MAG TPA: hypothetical protein VKH46_12600 [Thermoanaerobaculia bacterium]|nr:hypothetical protein [Thermoanaerobaculia bacterium]
MKSARGRVEPTFPRFDTSILVPALVAAALLGTTAAWIRSRGPVRLARPPTVLSNDHPAVRPIAPMLVFLDEVHARVPAGARVAFITPARDDGTLSRDFLIAVGRLPEQRVIPIFHDADKAASIDVADFVAAYGFPLDSPNLGSEAVFGGGYLYRAAR